MFCEDTMEDIRRIVDKNFYVDDYLASTDSVHDAVTLAEQLGSILKKGGFRLTKWIATVSKSLDPFHRVNMPEQTVTRRSILSSIASLYDPLGLLSPVILLAKQLLQRLCKLGLGWDVEIPEDERTHRFEFLNDMQLVENISFARCMLAPDMDHSLVELHTFSDASEVGYGVVAYSPCYVAGENKGGTYEGSDHTTCGTNSRSLGCRLNLKEKLKESVAVHLVVDEPGMHQLVGYYSDWKRLLKALAWILGTDDSVGP
ncbi:Gag-Pol polyprotein [Schistosoma japonicum]|uniref:Gag-Pol polyprotein n=1 Tax=Schistosoma japonicum TaxID=6182 RepID=A0A4Z2DIQ1_SCHJA|nr:Gag-Pol polyprotein [Schistosoma japonicum]